jgi:hypothetical protein
VCLARVFLWDQAKVRPSSPQQYLYSMLPRRWQDGHAVKAQEVVLMTAGPHGERLSRLCGAARAGTTIEVSACPFKRACIAHKCGVDSGGAASQRTSLRS